MSVQRDDTLRRTDILRREDALRQDNTARRGDTLRCDDALRRDDAMRHAVELARSGLCNNWWSVAARLRARRYQESDVDWTPGQRNWLDLLCAEARRAALDGDPWRPCA